MSGIKLIILTVVTFLLTTSALAKHKYEIQSRIVKGQDAVRGQFPYYVFLRVFIELRVFNCGGSLISNQWVVTAAHCLENVTGIEVHLGSLSAMNREEVGRKIINIPMTAISDHLYVHPNHSQLVLENDIGLIKLPSPVQFNDVIQPVNLACSSSNKTDIDVIAIGNGRLHLNQNVIPLVLQYAHMKTISLLKCFLYFPNVAFRNDIICSKGEKKQSICTGDSGGPLVEEKSQNLVGISSYISFWLGCEWGAPQVFSRVSEFLPWIERITGVTCKND